MKLKRDFLLLTWKKFYVIILIIIFLLAIHNIISYYFDIDEPVLFLLGAIIIPVYFLISLIYTILNKLSRKRFYRK
jgi:hypothetical protein